MIAATGYSEFFQKVRVASFKFDHQRFEWETVTDERLRVHLGVLNFLLESIDLLL